MPRSPFQGTFQPNSRPTIVTAPDAIVYINGETDVIGCSSCKRKFDLNKYITSVQVDLSVDSVPGSASIAMSIPRHAIDDFYVEGNPLITPMMEIEIYLKGYYLVEGIPQYYPAFWGIIGDVSDNYSGGEHTVSISCHDILKWWDICRMNVNPAFTAPSGRQGRSIYGNVFFGMNPYDVIWSLAQSSFGDVVIGTGSLISLYKEQGQRPTFNAALADMMVYWEQRFSRIRSNLLLYGVNGVAVRGSALNEQYRKEGKNKPGPFASKAVSVANGGPDATQMVYDPTSPSVTAFRTVFSQAGQVNFWQSEYQTKLELANLSKDALGFEFYMDVTGDIVFKPPFYNLDVLSNKPLSWIQDIDIIDWNFQESEAEVVTQLSLQGSFGGNVDYGFSEEATPFTSVTDYHLLRKYGWRPDTYNSEFLADPQAMFYHGLDILDRKNSRRFRGSVTIPMRSELRLGFPIYIAPKDEIWYITGISHNLAFGGRATTTLNLTAKRRKFLAPNGIGTLKFTGFTKGASTVSNPGGAAFKYSARTISQSAHFDLSVGAAASIPPVTTPQPGKPNPYEPLLLRHPKTGRLVGYPNVVMVYTRPFKPSNDKFKEIAGQSTTGSKQVPKSKKPDLNNIAKQVDSELQGQLANYENDRVLEKYATNRYHYGLNSAGVYVYAYESEKIIGEMVILPVSHVTTKNEQGQPATLFQGSSGMIRPVSDERGFEVTGHFRYGRGVALRDGALFYNNAGSNDRASVDVQLALSGGLFETLNAQSQGITTAISAYPNPADAVARMQPENLETAGIAGVSNPDMPQGKWVPGGNNFLSSATIGSAEQKGIAASVEAGQLSRALTVAEMTVKDGQTMTDADCACVLGRSDLAFINVGYQVKIVNPASPSNDRLFSNQDGFSNVSGLGEGAAASLNLQSTLINNPVAPSLIAPTGAELIARVEKYLTDLYTALDGPHQEYERSLRTGGQSPTEADQTGGFETDSPQQFGDLSPPFSAPNRYVLGDTSALVGNVSSAASNISETWNAFGRNLKQNTEKARLTQQLSNEKADLIRLQTERSALSRQAATNKVVFGPSPVDGIAALDQQIAALTQNIAKTQADLTQITNASNASNNRPVTDG